MRTTTARTTTLAAAAVLLLAACGGTDLPGYGSGVDPTGPAASASSRGPAQDGFTDPAEVAEAEPGGAMLLTVTDVRVEEHDGFDRVVLLLDGDGSPSWRVGHVDAALDPGTGEPVAVDGDAVLEVALTGTAMPMDSGVTEYGGDPVDGPGGAVEQVVYGFVYEGTTSVFVGVTDERPFRVEVQEDPPAVTVDVQH
ncbi:hypothetical protein ATJ88_2445 [Isoptericola jiangsuensis]|uniref:AMIN-like domain-containing protein n=1 Tax=Isoptericola jiangsuensis TaxID=548579 RepID=A0A2A9EXZ0_9MICO|nr:hypothetical protein [Isoptericola jiangsuensis]PFG43738.1 hypothetical protein ATJ88_2445 [Isoptericola jiangsuensis]